MVGCASGFSMALNPCELCALRSKGSSTAQSCGKLTRRQLASLNSTLAGPESASNRSRAAGSAALAEIAVNPRAEPRIDGKR